MKLTPQEIELIEIKREQERLEKEQKVLEKLEERNRRQQQTIQSCNNRVSRGEEQVNATKKFFQEFSDSRFKLEIHRQAYCTELKDYDTEEVYFTYNYVVPEAWISIEGTNAKIKVDHHVVYGSGYGRVINKGYKMFIDGFYNKGASIRRAYSNAKSVQKKILEYIEIEDLDTKKKQAVESLKKSIDFTKILPIDTLVENTLHYTPGYVHGRYDRIANRKEVTELHLLNGVQVKVYFYPVVKDGEVSAEYRIENIKYPSPDFSHCKSTLERLQFIAQFDFSTLKYKLDD